MKRIILISFSCIFLFVSSAAAATPRVVGGQPTTNSKYPWIVSMVDKSSPSSYWGHFCGGTLVAPRWVLTAAHCVQATSSKNYDLVLGRTNLKKRNGERLAAWYHEVAPGYDPSWTWTAHDLALVYLSEPSSRPTIPLSSLRPADGARLEVAGWGAKMFSVPNILQAGSVQKMPDQFCASEESYGADVYRPEDGMLCAGLPKGGVDSCQGDSGGPLLARDGSHVSLVGVVSKGIDCAAARYPGIYTDVSGPDLDWIKETISSTPDTLEKVRPGREYNSPSPQPRAAYGFWQITGGIDVLYLPEVYANRTVKKALVSLSSSANEDDRFCLEGQGCGQKGDWFKLDPSPGYRHWSGYMTSKIRCPVMHYKIYWQGSWSRLKNTMPCSEDTKKRSIKKSLFQTSF